MTIEEIIEINNEVYNILAPEYNEKMDLYTKHQMQVLKPFIDVLNENFKNDIHTLDVGCGVGLDLKIMNDHGFKTHGIDYSSKMVEYAKMNNPKSTILNSDFTSCDFDRQFHGVLLDAFIHLFPKKEVEKIFKKINPVLLHKGFAFISTTKHNHPREGLFKKEDYKSKIKRYRAYWSADELEMSINNFGFTIIKQYEDYETNFKKSWMNFIIQKS
ncbi:MAG: class I SAM-dependent methyltransferase [Candidatus Marinimicrobia bacterium]|nr:class I SAM-dependent methyltransferase [Candidatus Neomarinimicrobiota bacterium]